MKLTREFYDRDSLITARELLGKRLVHIVNGLRMEGIIVETEAYMGTIDKAAHSYNNKRTKRNEVMFGPSGHSYVYFIYGMYYCFNIVVNKIDTPEAVLVRALEPASGVETMAKNRFNKDLSNLNKRQVKDLTNGPGKLCMAMNIDISCNGIDLLGDSLFVEDIGYEEFEVVEAKRINIDYAEEAADYPWRFYIKGNPYVSKK